MVSTLRETSTDIQAQSDKLLGGLMLSVAAFVFAYYTAWAILLVSTELIGPGGGSFGIAESTGIRLGDLMAVGRGQMLIGRLTAFLGPIPRPILAYPSTLPSAQVGHHLALSVTPSGYKWSQFVLWEGGLERS